jgi:hypothetical protein
MVDHISWKELTPGKRIIEVYNKDGLEYTYIENLGSVDPKEKKMNDTINDIVSTDGQLEAEGTQHFVIATDEAGNETRIPIELAGTVQDVSFSEAAV